MNCESFFVQVLYIPFVFYIFLLYHLVICFSFVLFILWVYKIPTCVYKWRQWPNLESTKITPLMKGNKFLWSAWRQNTLFIFLPHKASTPNHSTSHQAKMTLFCALLTILHLIWVKKKSLNTILWFYLRIKPRILYISYREKQ